MDRIGARYVEYDYKRYYTELLRKRIDQLRDEKNISERQLSFELGKSRGYIGQITRGLSLPHIDALLEICEYFHITPSELFSENGPGREKLIENEFTDHLSNLDLEHKEKLNSIIDEMGIDQMNILVDMLYDYKYGKKNKSPT